MRITGSAITMRHRVLPLPPSSVVHCRSGQCESTGAMESGRLLDPPPPKEDQVAHPVTGAMRILKEQTACV